MTERDLPPAPRWVSAASRVREFGDRPQRLFGRRGVDRSVAGIGRP